MKRILFVDDERNVLESLRRSLRKARHRGWHMTFASSGRQALDELIESPYDAVVTDMHMPGMDGAELLREARTRRPDAVRIVLTGQSENDSAIRMISTAHRYLKKPFDPEALYQLIERTWRLQRLLDDPMLRRAAGQESSLPALPRTYSLLRSTIAERDVSIAEIAAIVEKDVGICAKVLHIVNSAFFGLPQKITDVRAAVAYLGTDTIEAITLSAEVFRPFADSAKVGGFSFEAFQRHSQLTARIASRIVEDPKQRNEAFLGGLLHDLGQLVLLTQKPHALESLLSDMAEHGTSMDRVEAETKCAQHSHLGAYLIGIWGLPYTIVEAVAHVHDPTAVDQEDPDVTTAVHVADALAHEVADAMLSVPPEHAPRLDVEYLQALGVMDSLPAWHEIALEVLAEDDWPA